MSEAQRSVKLRWPVPAGEHIPTLPERQRYGDTTLKSDNPHSPHPFASRRRAPVKKHPKRRRSEEAYRRACDLIPGGVNSPARAFGAVDGNPIFIDHGEGPY